MTSAESTSHWAAPHWQGSLETLADAAERALQELLSRGGAPPFRSIEVDVAEETRSFDSFDDFREAIPTLAPGEVRRVRIAVSDRRLGDVVRIGANPSSGLSVAVEGGDPFVEREIEALKRWLAPGEIQAALPEPRPLRGLEKAVLVLAALVGAGAIVVPIVLGLDLLLSISIVLAGAIAAAALTSGIPTCVQENPRLTLVPPEREPAPPPAAAEPRGHLRRTAAWLAGHPWVTSVVILALGGGATVVRQIVDG